MVLCQDCQDELAVLDWDRGTEYARWMGQATRYVPVCDTCYRARDNAEPPERGFEDAMAAKYPIEG